MSHQNSKAVSKTAAAQPKAMTASKPAARAKAPTKKPAAKAKATTTKRTAAKTTKVLGEKTASTAAKPKKVVFPLVLIVSQLTFPQAVCHGKKPAPAAKAKRLPRRRLHHELHPSSEPRAAPKKADLISLDSYL
ncbi:hypothetical protein B0H13DRAFT_2349335 [Mycena leptocephala]|nr:hypothetical protein B0H13DRAFT_2349335 [Mycena leptocephala]